MITEQGSYLEPARGSEAARLAFDAQLTAFFGGIDVETGAFLRTNRLRNDLAAVGGDNTELFFTEAGLYLEPELRIGEILDLGQTLRLRAGARLHSFPNDSRSYLEPRARLLWQFGAHEVSMAGGLYHQEIIGVTDRRDVASVFTAWTRAPLGEVASAWHALAGYRVQPTPGLEFVVEGYAKELDNIPVGAWTAFPTFSTDLQPATGTVRGIDTRLELRRGLFYGYLGYGLSRVIYDAKGETLQLWYGEESLRYNPPHDRRHQVSALVSTELASVRLSARWQFGSGLPFSRALGFDRFLPPRSPYDVWDDSGTGRVIYERPYNGRLPAFHRLDLSAERTFPLTNDLALTGQLGLINAYDRSNLFYYDTFTLRRVDQLPLIPSFGLKLATR